LPDDTGRCCRGPRRGPVCQRMLADRRPLAAGCRSWGDCRRRVDRGRGSFFSKPRLSPRAGDCLAPSALPDAVGRCRRGPRRRPVCQRMLADRRPLAAGCRSWGDCRRRVDRGRFSSKPRLSPRAGDCLAPSALPDAVGRCRRGPRRRPICQRMLADRRALAAGCRSCARLPTEGGPGILIVPLRSGTVAEGGRLLAFDACRAGVLPDRPRGRTPSCARPHPARLVAHLCTGADAPGF